MAQIDESGNPSCVSILGINQFPFGESNNPPSFQENLTTVGSDW
jgi:hypothetical protein